MKNQIARVLVTLKCERYCDGCCNNYKSVMKSAHRIGTIRSLDSYNIICITGGEPLLNWKRTRQIIDEIRDRRYRRSLSRPIIYLYTAKYIPEMVDVIRSVDGIHFTLHYPISTEDLKEFYLFQDLIPTYPNDLSCAGKSFRLYIDQRNRRPVTIHPCRWKRVEVKPWMTEGNCPLPKGETLFILKE